MRRLTEMAHRQEAGGRLRERANGRTLSPAIKEFLDDLAEMIADLIIEDDQGTGASSIEPAPTTRQGAEKP